jgi:hypothetical protein
MEKPLASMLGIDGSNHHTLLSLGPDCPHKEWVVVLLPMLGCAGANNEAKRSTAVSTE